MVAFAGRAVTIIYRPSALRLAGKSWLSLIVAGLALYIALQMVLVSAGIAFDLVTRLISRFV